MSNEVKAMKDSSLKQSTLANGNLPTPARLGRKKQRAKLIPLNVVGSGEAGEG